MFVAVAVMMVMGVNGAMIMVVMFMASVVGLMIVVMGVVVVAVIVIVALGSRRAHFGLHVGAALGIERRFERDHPCAKPVCHRLDDRIAADAQRLRQDFGRQMAVAEMPGDAGQIEPRRRF